MPQPSTPPEPVTASGAPHPTGGRGAVELLRDLVAQRPAGEVRPQQERMVAAVERAIATGRHLLVQAGTGTGKSLGYAVPAIASGQRVVISTATKQLSEQLVTDDLPTLTAFFARRTGKTVTYALLKGRNNYLCQRKIENLKTLDDQAADSAALFELDTGFPERPAPQDLEALNRLLHWAEHTTTGDRSEAPPVNDRVWANVSTGPAGCPGARVCPFGSTCFAEQARATAREADVVVTNHAQLAQDLAAKRSILGDYDVLIVDEAHELETYLSSAWGTTLNPTSLAGTLTRVARKLTRDPSAETTREIIDQALQDLTTLGDVLLDQEPGLKPTLPGQVAGLLSTLADRLATITTALTRAAEHAPTAVTAAEMQSLAGEVSEATETVQAVLAADNPDESVRWLEITDQSAILNVAPLRVGPQLMLLLGTTTLIATSATLTVGGKFDAMARTLALGEQVVPDQQPRGFDALDVGTPFRYDQQAILYIPHQSFPEPAGRDRAAHSKAVLEELTALVRAAGGRTLALFTSSQAVLDAARHLRASITTPVLVQGEAPASQLLTEFAEVEESTLCATMGFWHGVNVPGPALSLVVMDKIPFAPADDPLMAARRGAVDNAGRNGFVEVYVAGAAIMLAQGAGRLIRTATDRGVVAILDPRLRTKGYGRTLLRSLPPMRQFTDRAVVEAALARLIRASHPTSTVA